MEFNERNALLMRLQQLVEHEKNLVEQLRNEREMIFTRLNEIDELDFYYMEEPVAVEKRDFLLVKGIYLN
ncbi:MULTISPECIES: hypothetical protein [Bacillus]|uniref:hypothetical protein n=1 Tax=Bacillus TaxID=1386 RepID=UPI0001A19409|nr:hypothetical protein [Bacillus pseudomycoides]EEM14670.1 hypothetical protein bpmyx0001_45350 [Bacillus pseudomycoides DSM 12442]MED1597279.1 hypothetical protein [Bacillus pseudomycoides]MED4713676.1 hypothetical protein [Bacillus pseudomycoides]OOR49435.1 hypothetical protein BLX05_24285 [Bacillus pseudomycoides]PDY14816.1 hypothetical protein COO16_01070 [Bacillus pseudomycoides]